MSAAEILEQIKHLSPVEQRMVAAKVWEEYGGIEDELTPEQIAELDRRLADFEKYPHDGVPWEQVEANLNKRFGWK
jgi:putative addiction module component (TIGR02574 family)